MRNSKGFTLIEVMITVVIVAIIAAVAFPAYQDSVRKSRRADAKAALLKHAQILERCFTEFNAYNNTTCGVVSAGPTIDETSDEGYYTIKSDPGSGETLTANAYTLTATPTSQGNQNEDTACSSFELDQTGKRESNAAGDDTAGCW